MPVARVLTSALSGLQAVSVEVEASIRKGKDRFEIIGLGDNAVREAKDRVHSALTAIGVEPPKNLLINLAPADLKKEGSSLDLPIAVSVLAARGLLPRAHLRKVFFTGELSLDGRLKAVRGGLVHAICAKERQADCIVLPVQNMKEASLVQGIEVVGVSRLSEVIEFLLHGVTPDIPSALSCRPEIITSQKSLNEVVGQGAAKRAMEIAAAGQHNLLMIGPPGCGKSMLAERLSSLLPKLDEKELLEVCRVHSIAGSGIEAIVSGERVFRSPHHGISEAGMIGGGSTPRPGEASLAHQGVLFLDEFPEYKRSVLEALRTPLETGVLQISRASGSAEFPARFQLIAAMNPCPCGRLGVKGSECLCSRAALQKYLQKISQPILDRIDLHVELEAVPLEGMISTQKDRQASLDDRISKIQRARERAKDRGEKLTSQLSVRDFHQKHLSPSALQFLKALAERSMLSARGFVKVLRVSRTIADLSESDLILDEHLTEAVSYRAYDRLLRFAGLETPAVSFHATQAALR